MPEKTIDLSVYDEKYYANVDWSKPKLILICLKNNCKNKSVLDIGCGLGLFGEEIQKYSKSYLGIDTSEHAISICKKKHINSIQCSIDNIGFYKTDVLICIEILEHLTDNEIRDMFKKINFKKIIITVPRAKGSDKTHINIKTVVGWLKFFDDMKIHLKVIDKIEWADNQSLSDTSILFEG